MWRWLYNFDDKTINTMTTTNTVRIYVGTYAKYNAGNLKGAWLDLEDYSDQDEFLEACKELHSDEADPELMFQDSEGFPDCWYSESSAPPAILWEWLGMDASQREAFGLYADNQGGDVEVSDFEDSYNGVHDSEASFAEQMAEDCGDIPKDMPSWIVIDWQGSWNAGLRFDYWCGRGDSGDLHFFRSN